MSDGNLCMFIVYPLFLALVFGWVIVRFRELRRARHWPSTVGKVIANGVKAHQRQPGDASYGFHDTEVTNEPWVEYEYEVAGQTYRSKRYTIGERTSVYELEDILARHPVGAAVTVYYDPADPQTAVLENVVPWYLFFVVVGFLLFLFVGVPLVAALFYYGGVAWLQAHLPYPDRAPLVAVTAGFGLAVLCFALALTRMVWQVCKWPIARGRIIASDVQAFQKFEVGTHRRRTYFKPVVMYTYEVNGRPFTGDRVRIALAISATLPLVGRWLAARYPVGMEVDVSYNPQNPGESVLQPNSWGHYVLWLIGAGLLGLAWAYATGRVG